MQTGLFFKNLPRAALSVNGKDRTVFLHRLLSNDIKGLRPGQGKPACLLDRQGKILFSCTAHARPEEILLEMDPSFLPSARAALERYVVADAVEFSDATARFRVLSAYGTGAKTLQASPPPGGFAAGSPWAGMPGLDLWLPAADPQAGDGFIETAQAAGMKAGDAQAFEALRIETGIPWPGHEITSEVILNELGRDEEFVSFTKGCYVGQEIVARIKHRAHPPRLLQGFLLEGEDLPAPGGRLLQEDKPVGTLTSSCFSPMLERAIGLGFLNYGLTEGIYQVAGSAGDELRAELTRFPFV